MMKQPERMMMSEEILEVLDTGVSKHYLDDGLSVIWCNPAFYRMLGYGEEDFLQRYPDFGRYYEAEPRGFEGMQACFEDAYGRGERSAKYRGIMTGENGRTIWAEMTGTFVKQAGEGPPVVYILYSDIGEWMPEQSELCRRRADETENFKWLMSEYAGNVYISDMDTYELLYLNKHASDTLQTQPEQVVGSKCYETIQGRTSPCPFCTNRYLKKNGTYEWEFYNPNLKRTFIIKNRMLEWEGRRVRIELSYDMYSTEYKLAKKDQEREAILKTVPAGMIRLDSRDYRTVLWYNDIFLEMIGYTKAQFEEELHNQCVYLHPDDFKRAVMMARDLKKSGENVVLEARAYTRAKEERIWTVTLCYISGEDSWDGIPSLYSVGLDVTEERRKMETLKHRAEKDALTGIYNRAETELQIKKHLMDNPDTMDALFMIDTDNFKQINDTRGHMIGDAVLTEIASGMKKIMRDSDVVGRIGGDEFTVFMKNISSAEDAAVKAEELLNLFRHLFEAEKSPVKVSCSMGIAVYPKDGRTFSEIYACADKALYQAKSRGKDSFVIYNGDASTDMGGTGPSSLGAAIDSERRYAEGPDNLARYVFRNLYQTRDFNHTVNTILEIVGKQLDVSRAYIFENTDGGQYGSNTYEWCNEGIAPQMEKLQNVRYKDYRDYESLFDENMIFYCRDIHNLKPEQEALFADQGVHSTLQCAFRSEAVFAGFVGFDECTGLRLWTQEEVSTLLLVSQILSVFLLQNKGMQIIQPDTETGMLTQDIR